MTDQILINSLRTPDGTVLTSRFTHDYVTYVDANGKKYMVDGGLSYLRRSYNGDEIDLSIHMTDNHEFNRRHFHWGTYGKKGKGPFKYKKLLDMDADHIEAILETQTHISGWIQNIFEQELKFRK